VRSNVARAYFHVAIFKFLFKFDLSGLELVIYLCSIASWYWPE
jgi:hypothetical protein